MPDKYAVTQDADAYAVHEFKFRMPLSRHKRYSMKQMINYLFGVAALMESLASWGDATAMSAASFGMEIFSRCSRLT